jgi:uncharacterized protein (TIGR02246 family)
VRFIAPATTRNLPADRSKTVSAQTPQACDELFVKYMNSGDIDALVSLYEPTGTLMQSDGTRLIGQSAIRAHFTPILRRHPTITSNVVKIVQTQDEDLAMLYNNWHVSIRRENGELAEISGKAIELVRRQSDGSWRFVFDDPGARDAR